MLFQRFCALRRVPSASSLLSSQSPWRSRACVHRLGLIRDPRRGSRCGRRVTEVVVLDRLQVVVELVDQRDAGRDVELDDFGFGDAVEIHDQRPERIAVRGDEDPLAGPDRRRDRRVPVRQEARDRVLERFGQRQLGRVESRRSGDRVRDAAGRPASSGGGGMS